MIYVWKKCAKCSKMTRIFTFFFSAKARRSFLKWLPSFFLHWGSKFHKRTEIDSSSQETTKKCLYKTFDLRQFVKLCTKLSAPLLTVILSNAQESKNLFLLLFLHDAVRLRLVFIFISKVSYFPFTVYSSKMFLLIQKYNEFFFFFYDFFGRNTFPCYFLSQNLYLFIKMNFIWYEI